jgi:tetratricopeptide (TPR) repeat protein
LKLQSLIRSYSKLWVNSWVAGFLLSPTLSFPDTDLKPSKTEFISSCSSEESWTFSQDFEKSVSPIFIERFHQFLKKEVEPLQGFAEALALRNLALTTESKFFSEYWISRSLWQGGLIEIAQSGFSSLVSRPPTIQSWPFQIAALQCLQTIERDHPSFGYSDPVVTQLPPYFDWPQISSQSRQILNRAALQLVLHQLSQPQSLSSITHTLGFLRGSGSFETFANALFQLQKGNLLDSIKEFNLLLKEKALPNEISNKLNLIHLYLGRSYYSLGHYRQAIAEFKKVNKQSNELTHSLTGLAWSHLMEENYPEAIGLGISVQSGWMKQTFTPEPLLVAAMALNEICHFPESQRLIQLFRSEYRTSHEWLKNYHDLTESARPALYPIAIQFLKKQPISVPSRVASEWIRSPIFLAHQDKIHLLFDQKKAVDAWAQNGKRIQNEQARQLLKGAQDLRKQYRSAKILMKPGDELPVSLLANFQTLKKNLTHYRRLTRAAVLWKKILISAERRSLLKKQDWIHKIEQELSSINHKLYQDLIEFAENNDLIEVEILNGASDDMIQKNAEGKNSRRKRKLGEQKTSDSALSSGDVYQWGESASTLSGSGELWEDELDSMKANLTNQCRTGRP